MSESKHRQPLHDIGDLDPEGLPSERSLIKATVIALLIGAAVLVMAILPAEYGIDPTGLGGRLGLTALNEAGMSTQTVVTEPVERSAGAVQSHALTLPLMPGQGLEVKAIMHEGQSFVFEWVAEGGAVYVDMHGDREGAAEDEFTSFWIADALARAGGTFRAPFTGRHGWYWKNNGDQMVTIRLKTSGFYEELYMP